MTAFRLLIPLCKDLLKDEKSDIDLAGPTLPSLKAILDTYPSKADTEAISRYNRLIHGLFSSCITNIDEMRLVWILVTREPLWTFSLTSVFRGRQGVISRRKITNNLLAAVLILTVVAPYIGFSDTTLEYCFSLISQKLLEKEVSFITLFESLNEYS